MTKQVYKFYIEPKDYKMLIQKARECGYIGRGALSHFLAYLATNEIIFLDKNCKQMLRAIQFK